VRGLTTWNELPQRLRRAGTSEQLGVALRARYSSARAARLIDGD